MRSTSTVAASTWPHKPLNSRKRHFCGQALSWRVFSDTAKVFFTLRSGSYDAHDKYFTNFEIVWRYFLSLGRLGEAEHIWDLALRPALEWEQESRVSGLRIHKGTPYYFWGMTALLRGDLDRGYCLIHQAVSEDSATNPETYRTLPGFALATLDYEKPDQAFRQWVLQQADFLAKRVVRYSDIHGRPFVLSDFQDRFLRQPPDTDTLFLFAHVVARLMQLSEIPGYLI